MTTSEQYEIGSAQECFELFRPLDRVRFVGWERRGES